MSETFIKISKTKLEERKECLLKFIKAGNCDTSFATLEKCIIESILSEGEEIDDSKHDFEQISTYPDNSIL